MSLVIRSLRSLAIQNAYRFGKLSINQVPNRSIARWVSPTLRVIRKRAEIYGSTKPQPRHGFLEWNLRAELYAFGKRLNENFDDKLLLEAFTERSYIIQQENEQKALGIEEPDLNLRDNRELAEKGHEIINKYVLAFLKRHLTKYPAEGIAALQNWLVSDEQLALISKNLGTTDIILSEEYPPSQETYVRTLKALIGAIAESSAKRSESLDAAYNFVRDFVCVQLNQQDINELWAIEEPFTLLQTVCAQYGITQLEPRIIGETGKNTILATCRIGIYDANTKKFLGAGFGENYDNGIHLAATDALSRLFGTKNLKPFNYQITVSDCFSDAKTESLRVAAP